ncbi:MAG: DUF1829 domain-containing protein, partial [Alphaproteobacteria bacterium]|nr:DUF1829 domain-containing protein [Alphaproteobacteria bacterium]
HDIRYSPRVKISGRSGYDHAIDFVIPKSKNRPERFIKTINTPTKNSIVPCLFALEEAKAARENGTLAYAFLNDSANVVPGDVAVALRQYEVHAVAWSSRMEYRDELAA